MAAAVVDSGLLIALASLGQVALLRERFDEISDDPLKSKTARVYGVDDRTPPPPIGILRVGVLQSFSKQFDGNTALIAAAYNAGETAAEKWKGLAPAYDEDERIEQISSRETRGYVNAILRNMCNYRSIYGTPTG